MTQVLWDPDPEGLKTQDPDPQAWNMYSTEYTVYLIMIAVRNI